MNQPKVSGFVVSYNRDQIIETCLQSIRWVDELIVADKSSTDRTPEIARRYADRIVTVPWSPTVEETRYFAASLATHDFVVFLDDDETFSVKASTYFRSQALQPCAAACRIPCRHYVLGQHDERAYYWPEAHVRAYVKGGLVFKRTVHSGYTVDGAVRTVAADQAVMMIYNRIGL